MQEAYIQFDNVSKDYKNFKAVKNLSLTVNKGDIYAFLGPNGAGKSTSIRMLLSLIKPTSGSINLFGHDLNVERYKTLSRIGALIEKPDFYKYLTAEKNLRLLGEISNVENLDSKIDEVLELVKLSDRRDSKFKTFSQGMKQRLGIAQTLLHDPDLIVLDEPANGLDPQGQKEMRNLIKDINNKGITIVISSHILAEVEQIANRMVIINKGQKVVEGEVQELLLGSGMRLTVIVDDSEKAKKAIEGTRWESVYEKEYDNKLYFRIPKNDIPELNNFLTQKELKVFSLEPVRSLEDYFISMTEDNADIN